MSAPAAMAPDAIEIHPGTPNIYYEQGVVKGEDTKPIMERADVVTAEVETYCSRQPHLVLEPDCGFSRCPALPEKVKAGLEALPKVECEDAKYALCT